MRCHLKTDLQVMLELWIEGAQGDQQEVLHIGTDIGKLREAEVALSVMILDLSTF